MMVNKDPGKMHFYMSLAKSMLRIVGCGAVLWGVPNPIFTLAVAFGLAEIIGIVEEL